MARPTLCTPEITRNVCRHIRRGVSYEDAATCAGVSRASIMDWMARGRAGEMPFADFLDAVEKARTDGKSTRLARIAKAARKGAWQADAWWLERVHPGEFGRRVVEHTGANGGPIRIASVEELPTASDDALRALAAAANREPEPTS